MTSGVKFVKIDGQRLLAENKFGICLLYATGEIVLIVLGILIALAINSWNKNRKERNQRINLFTKNTNTNNTNVIDEFTTSTWVENGTFTINGNSDRMMKKFKDFYSFKIDKVEDENLKIISTRIINEPAKKLSLINKIVFRNTLSNMQISGNRVLNDRSTQILKKLEDEIKSAN